MTADAQKTPHPKIMRAREEHLPSKSLDSGLAELITHLEANDLDGFKDVLSELVIGYGTLHTDGIT